MGGGGIGEKEDREGERMKDGKLECTKK